MCLKTCLFLVDKCMQLWLIFPNALNEFVYQITSEISPSKKGYNMCSRKTCIKISVALPNRGLFLSHVTHLCRCSWSVKVVLPWGFEDASSFHSMPPSQSLGALMFLASSWGKDKQYRGSINTSAWKWNTSSSFILHI